MKLSDLVKFVVCTLVSRVQMTFSILTKTWTVPGNQGTHDKLNLIQNLCHLDHNKKDHFYVPTAKIPLQDTGHKKKFICCKPNTFILLGQENFYIDAMYN